MPLKKSSKGAVKDVHHQREVFGYGIELTDALAEYHRAYASGGKNKIALLEDFAAWIEKCPHASSICFADVFSCPDPNLALRESIALLFTPRMPKTDPLLGYRQYMDGLDSFWTPSKEWAFAPHAIFAKGMPVSRIHSQLPKTLEEFEAWQTSAREDGAEDLRWESGMFMTKLSLRKESPLPPAAPKARKEPPYGTSKNFVAMEINPAFEQLVDTKRFPREYSNKPLKSVWTRWVQMHLGERSAGRFLSQNKRPVEWLIAAPIGYRYSRNNSEFRVFAILFLGCDQHVNEKQILEVLRYLFLHLIESNATVVASQHGEIDGFNAFVTPARHELKKLVPAIELAPRGVRKWIREYFEELLVNQSAPRATGDILSPQANEYLRLQTLIRMALHRSAQLEEVVRMSDLGELNGERPRVVQRRIDVFVKKLLQCSTSPNKTELDDCVCDKHHKKVFASAVLAALRNAIRHTMDKQNPSIQISVTRGDNLHYYLSIVNSFERNDDFQFDSESRNSGTIGALRCYVRQYEKDPSAVSVSRDNQQSRIISKRPRRIREVWRTILPLPSLSSPQK